MPTARFGPDDSWSPGRLPVQTAAVLPSSHGNSGPLTLLGRADSAYGHAFERQEFVVCELFGDLAIAGHFRQGR
jgi:hypothetical protein